MIFLQGAQPLCSLPQLDREALANSKGAGLNEGSVVLKYGTGLTVILSNFSYFLRLIIQASSSEREGECGQSQ